MSRILQRPVLPFCRDPMHRAGRVPCHTAFGRGTRLEHFSSQRYRQTPRCQPCYIQWISSVGVEDFRAVSKRRGGKASLFSEVRDSDGRRLRDGMGWDVALHYGDADRDCKTNLAGTSRSNEYFSDFSLGAHREGSVGVEYRVFWHTGLV
jgi:hypothetical protein